MTGTQCPECSRVITLQMAREATAKRGEPRPSLLLALGLGIAWCALYGVSMYRMANLPSPDGQAAFGMLPAIGALIYFCAVGTACVVPLGHEARGVVRLLAWIGVVGMAVLSVGVLA